MSARATDGRVGARYRSAILGCNWITTDPTPSPLDPAIPLPMPVSHAGGYAVLPDVELTAICDASPAAIAEFVRCWGDRWPDLRTYSDYGEMLTRERPDLLSVCTPDNLHATHVVAACEAGVRAIFCEKPLATTVADGERMLDTVARHKVAFSVDVTRRWSPDYHQAREMIRAGKIGRLRLIVAVRGGPKGWLYRAGGHLYDLACFFAEAEPEWLVGELDEGYEEFQEWWGGGVGDPDADPGGNAYVHFANGVRASINCSRTLPHGYQVELLGTRGRIWIDDTRTELWAPATADSIDLVQWPVARQPHRSSGILAGLREMVRLLDNGGEGVSTGRDALRALKLIVATVESNRRHGARVDIAPTP